MTTTDPSPEPQVRTLQPMPFSDVYCAVDAVSIEARLLLDRVQFAPWDQSVLAGAVCALAQHVVTLADQVGELAGLAAAVEVAARTVPAHNHGPCAFGGPDTCTRPDHTHP